MLLGELGETLAEELVVRVVDFLVLGEEMERLA
jgi:hypothetical protein